MRILDPNVDRNGSKDGSARRIMPMDVFESDGTVRLSFDLPGVDPDHVDVKIEGQVLTISAERASENTDDVRWLWRERPSGTHFRHVRLADRLDTEHIDCEFARGVLEISIPVREEAKPRKIAISAGDHQQLEAAVAS